MSDHRWCPDKCPITGRAFFCWIEDEDGSQVPTYGGPFDSYTLPEQDEDGEFTVKHYDHDLGGWRDYMNLGVRLIDDQREDHEWGTVEALQARIAEQEAAIALMRGQSWQPIDSAPMDGTRILVSTPYDGIRTSHWEGGLWQGLPWRMARYEKLARPTHWQPLPAPPKDTADEQ